MTAEPKTWTKNGLTITASEIICVPTAQFSGRRRMWMLADEFSMVISSRGMLMEIKVPAGYRTDWASMPWFAELVLGPRDTYPISVLCHDWCCSEHLPAWIANQWLRSALFCEGAPKYRRVLFFWTVQLLGYGSTISRLAARVANFFRRKT